MQSKNTSSADEKLLADLKQLVIENLGNEEFGTRQLVEASGMSRSSLYRKIIKITGKSTTRFIRDIRLEQSLEALSSEQLTIAEVAYKVGFSSATYYNKAFKDRYGVTPGDIRENGTSHLKSDDKRERRALPKLDLWLNLAGAAVLIFIFGLLLNFKAQSRVNNPRPATISEKEAIAVLPLMNWTGDPKNDYIAYGITDALVAELSSFKGFKSVVPMIRVLELKDKQSSAKELIDELNIDKIIHGNLQTSEDQFKITVEFTDIANNKVLWSEAFRMDPGSEDIFGIQDKISAAVAENFGISNDSIGNPKPGYDHGTTNTRAYHAYLKAQYTASTSSTTAMKKAVPLFKSAIAADPGFTEAYVGLASLYVFGGAVWGMEDPAEGWEKAKELLIKAQEKDPGELNVTYMLMTGAFYYEWNFDYVEAIYDPEDDFNMLSIDFDYLIKTGRDSLAQKHVLQAVKDNPNNGGLYPLLAMHALVNNQKEKAEQILDAHFLKYPKDLFFLRESTKCYLTLGNYDKARQVYDSIRARYREDAPIFHWFEAVLALQEGKMQKNKRHLEILERKHANGIQGSPAWFLSMYYFQSENPEKGFEWLKRSYNNREVEMTWLKQEPLLKPYRNYRQYRDLLAKMKFPEGDFSRRKSTTVIP